MEKLYIIKIGGNIIDSPKELDSFLQQFSAIKGYKILIHGGGKLATEIAEKSGIKQTLVDGRRITDAETLKIAVMVYAGWINKSITAKLQVLKCNAIGLSGADANLITAEKRKHPSIDFGFVGDILPDGIKSKSIMQLLESNFVPVFCAITHDGKGQLLNTNADTMASALAVALANSFEVSLVYCFEKKGVLLDADDDSSLIPELSVSGYEALKQKGIVTKGMIPKLDNAFNARKLNVQNVMIGHSSQLAQMINKQKDAATYILN